MYTSIASVEFFPPEGEDVDTCMKCSAGCCQEEWVRANVNCRTKFLCCIWKFSFHLWFNFFPDAMLVVQSCCFLIVGWRGNSSGFYMKIAFSLPPFNIKIFYNFYFLFVARHYSEMELWIIIMCNGNQTLDALCSTQHSYPQIVWIPQNIIFPFKSSIFQKTEEQ